jgi:hypothetical protein
MNRSLPATLLVLAMVCGGCSLFHRHEVPDSGERITRISAEDAPKALRHGIERDYPGSRITMIERTRDDGRLQYIVYLTTYQNEQRELRYDANGFKLGNR